MEFSLCGDGTELGVFEPRISYKKLFWRCEV